MRRRIIVIAEGLVIISLALLLSRSTLFSLDSNPVPGTQHLAAPAGEGLALVATPQPSGIASTEKASSPLNTAVSFDNGIKAGQVTKHDISPRLRDLQVPFETPAAGVSEMGDADDNMDQGTLPGPVLPQISDPVLQSSFGSLLSPLPAMATNLNFEGVGNLDSIYPPDSTGDVGPNNYVQWVNLHFEIFDKTGKSILGPLPGNILWSGFGDPCETENIGDVQVLYDSLANRWVMGQFAGIVDNVYSPPFGECLAVSTTGDPTGSYYRYFFKFSSTAFYDYPKLGLWPDGYYLSANRFDVSTLHYLGPSAIVLDRADMLSGQTAYYQEFQPTNSYGTLLPVNLDGSTVPPSGEPAFFLDLGANTLHLWKLHVDWNTPSNSSFSGPVSLSTAAFNPLCTNLPTRNCVPQPETNVGLDGIGDRLMQRLNYRNFGSYEALVVSHNVNAASSGVQAGIRWYEIRDPNGSPVIYQQGTYAPDSNGRWMGSIAMDKDGNIALAYSVSSSTVYPGIRFSGRLASDPSGVLDLGETTIINGSGSQTGTASRWGDYSNLVLDPVDNCTFWYTTEYMAASGTAAWHTRIAAFKFPSCSLSETSPDRIFLPEVTR